MDFNERMKVSANPCDSVARQPRQIFHPAPRPNFNRVPQQGLAGRNRNYIEALKVNIRQVAHTTSRSAFWVFETGVIRKRHRKRAEAFKISLRSGGKA